MSDTKYFVELVRIQNDRLIGHFYLEENARTIARLEC
jgi:hypothetical protein